MDKRWRKDKLQYLKIMRELKRFPEGRLERDKMAREAKIFRKIIRLSIEENDRGIAHGPAEKMLIAASMKTLLPLSLIALKNYPPIKN